MYYKLDPNIYDRNCGSLIVSSQQRFLIRITESFRKVSIRVGVGSELGWVSSFVCELLKTLSSNPRYDVHVP